MGVGVRVRVKGGRVRRVEGLVRLQVTDLDRLVLHHPVKLADLLLAPRERVVDVAVLPCL